MNNIKNSYRVIIFFTVLFIFTGYILSHGVLTGDDSCFIFLDGGIKPFKNFYYGSWLMCIMNALFYYIPSTFDINIQDWCAIISPWFKSTVITLIFIFFFKIFKKNNLSVLNSTLFTAIFYMLFFILHSNLKFSDFIINQGFFRFIAVSLLIEIFLYYLYYDNETKQKKILLHILAFLAASASEAAFVILIVNVFLLYIYKKDRNYLSVLFMLITGFLCLSETAGFKVHFTEKMNVFTFSPNDSVKLIPLFAKKVICDYFPIYLYSILLMLKDKKINPNFCITLLSTFIFYSVFLVITKNPYGYNWLEHPDLYSFLIIMLLFTTAMTVKNPNMKISVLIFLLLITPFYNSAVFIKNSLINIKNFTYSRDKIRLFYEYKNRPAIMPEYSRYYMFHAVRNDIILNPEFDISTPTFDNEKDEYYIIKITDKFYYPQVYKITPKTKRQINHNAIEMFKEQGGSLDEVKRGKYKFSNLSDKNFVLNNRDIKK